MSGPRSGDNLLSSISGKPLSISVSFFLPKLNFGSSGEIQIGDVLLSLSKGIVSLESSLSDIEWICEVFLFRGEHFLEKKKNGISKKKIQRN